MGLINDLDRLAGIIIDSADQITLNIVKTLRVKRGSGHSYIYPRISPDATVAAKAATANLAASDFQKNLTNTGASGAIVLTLPAASTVEGKNLKIHLLVAQQVSLSPAATDAIYLSGSGVDNKDLVIPGVIGNYVEIYSDGTNYHVIDSNGAITKEA